MSSRDQLDVSRLRPRDQIAADRAACESYQSSSRTDCEQGAIDAYDWLLGQGPAPLSGPVAVTPQSVVAEERLAHDAAGRKPGAPAVSGAGARWTESYVTGVRHALRWARYASRTSPGGAEDLTGLPGLSANARSQTGEGTLVVEPERRAPRYRRRWEE